MLLATVTSVGHALTYDEAQRLAEARASQLQARQNAVAAAQSARLSAGRLPDPKLLVGIENLPVSGPDAWNANRDFMTMEKIGVMQDVPNGGKREAARELAQANIAHADAELQIERLNVKRETAIAWLRVYFLQQKRDILAELDTENRMLTAAVTARLAAGQGKASDALLARQEAATLADRRDDLDRDLIKAQATLARWVGKVEEPASGDLPVLTHSVAFLRHAIDRHPELAVFNSLEDTARAEVAMAQAAKQPDWGVEIAYQRRALDYSNMVSVQFSIDLPLFSKTRQDPQIAAKQQELERVTAERETMIRQHMEELEDMLAERSTLTRQIARLDSEWLPLSQQKVDLATADYRAGQEPLTSVLDARKSLIDTRMKKIDLEARRAEVDASLFYFTTEKQP
ncbi:MAG: TolC family protein [Gammaproteobacteria bacterium]|nr:TolC family protein [Gammaproteobacteria bacterium]